MFRGSGPGLRGGNGCEAPVLTVHKDGLGVCGLFAVEPGRVRCAAALRRPQTETEKEPQVVTRQAVNRGGLSETSLYLCPRRGRLAALRPLPLPGLLVSVHWRRRRKRSRELKRRKKGLARILGPAAVDCCGQSWRQNKSFKKNPCKKKKKGRGEPGW